METAAIANDLGTIYIADQVIAVIARDTALSMEGVYGMDDRSHGIQGVISNEDAEGVKVSVKNGVVTVDMYICFRHGFRIPALALTMQEAVKENIKNVTGISVNSVNINVQQIIFEADG